MSVEIRVPVLGESVLEATVARWLKKEGEAVGLGEILVELETDKVNVEVSSDAAGTIESIRHREGETVRPGEVLGAIAEGAAAPSPVAPGAGAEAPAEPHAEPAGSPEEAREEVRATPLAQRAAEDLHVNLASVPASGPGGRVTREDVEDFARINESKPGPAGVPQPAPTAQPAAIPAPPKAAPSASPSVSANGMRPETRERLSRRRQTIATRLVEAQHNAALLTTFNEVDMTAVMELRTRWKESFQKRHGVGLGFMSFFTKAVIGALKAFPVLNAEIQGDELVLKHYYDIGVAIGDPEGLVVPVIRDADRLSFAGVEKAIAGYVEKSKNKTLTLEDLRGGTFTITNGGVFGSLLSTPIINPPQVGILGMHKIQQRPVAIDGQVVVRPMMYIALTYDHRIVDGRGAVQFLVRVKELIEDPEQLLLEG